MEVDVAFVLTLDNPFATIVIDATFVQPKVEVPVTE